MLRFAKPHRIVGIVTGRMGKSKYYAVAYGRTPGVYNDWTTAEAQVRGYAGARHKSFSTKEAAQAWVTETRPGIKIAGVSSSMSTPSIAKDPIGKARKRSQLTTSPGWSRTVERAEQYSWVLGGAPGGRQARSSDIGQGGNDNHELGGFGVYEEYGDVFLGEPVDSDEEGSGPGSKLPAKNVIGTTTQVSALTTTPASRAVVSSSPPTVTQVWTDGACRGNGKKGARAGWGVYFGEGDARNIFGKLQGTPQTNQRAELQAALYALVNTHGQTILYTDSNYVKKGCNEWLPGWKKRGWVNSSGNAVANQDLWKRMDAMLQERGHELRIEKVKAHSGDPGSDGADKLACMGADLND